MVYRDVHNMNEVSTCVLSIIDSNRALVHYYYFQYNILL